MELWKKIFPQSGLGVIPRNGHKMRQILMRALCAMEFPVVFSAPQRPHGKSVMDALIDRLRTLAAGAVCGAAFALIALSVIRAMS